MQMLHVSYCLNFMLMKYKLQESRKTKLVLIVHGLKLVDL